MLRVDARGIPRGDPEKARVEPVDRREEAGPANVHLPGSRAVRVVPGARVPPVRRDLHRGVDPLGEEPPEGVRTIPSPGEAAPDADHGDRLPPRLLGPLEALIEPLDRQERPLQGGERLDPLRQVAHHDPFSCLSSFLARRTARSRYEAAIRPKFAASPPPISYQKARLSAYSSTSHQPDASSGSGGDRLALHPQAPGHTTRSA